MNHCQVDRSRLALSLSDFPRLPGYVSPALNSNGALHPCRSSCKSSRKLDQSFEVFSATDFLAAITHHITDKGAQMVHYYGRYSNKTPGTLGSYTQPCEDVDPMPDYETLLTGGEPHPEDGCHGKR
jgi:hypothetical protein